MLSVHDTQSSTKNQTFEPIILGDADAGITVLDRANANQQKYSQVRSLKTKIESDLREHLGPDAVVDAVKVPLWRAGIHAEREKVACRH